MESGVRQHDWFDIDKIAAVCEGVHKSGLTRPDSNSEGGEEATAPSGPATSGMDG